MDPDPQPLSLFQQTLLENDELFYKTFPAARLALQQNQAELIWRTHYQVADFAGYSFQPDYHPFAHPLPNHRLDAVQCVSHFYTLHDQLSPRRVPPSEIHHEPSSDLVTPSLHAPDMQYLPQYPQQHPYSSPVPDALASPPSFSHTPYPNPPHLISSPIQSDVPPVTPPALVPSILCPIQTEPEQQLITDQSYSPSSAPPRRGSQHHITTYRSQRRYSPLFNRTPHSTHTSGGIDSAHSISVPVMEWTAASPPTTVANTNVGSSLANAVNDITPPVVQAVATVIASVSSSTAPEARPLHSDPIPGSSNTNTGGNSKRNPDKKPALACVFCRGRKIACGPPLKDGDGKSCNQCQRRSLRCEYPTESRRGMRKKPAIGSTTSSASSSMKAKRNTSSNAKLDASSSSPKLVVKNKRR